MGDQVRTELPLGYGKRVPFDPMQNGWFVAGAVTLGIVLLLASAWLPVQFLDTVRPEALDGFRLGDLVTETGGGGVSFTLSLPLVGSTFAALILALVSHELVHGLFYWWYARRRPTFGVKGLLPYVSAPSGIYFPRTQFLVVGLAPLLLLNTLGMLATLVAPPGIVFALLVLCAVNASGSAGDLLMVVWLLARPAGTYVEDAGAGVITYGPPAEPAN